MLKIKKNDQIVVIAGKDKGKSGRVLYVLPKKRKVIVENINMVKKAKRRTQQDQQGGFIDIEVPIHLSNVSLIDKKSSKPTRYSNAEVKDGSKQRVSKKSGTVI